MKKNLEYLLPFMIVAIFLIFMFITSLLIPFIFIKILPTTFLGWIGIILCCLISLILNTIIILYLTFMACLAIEDKRLSEVVTDIYNQTKNENEAN